MNDSNHAWPRAAGGPVVIPSEAFAAPFEQLIMVYGVGRATISPDQRYISCEADVFQVDESPAGRWSGTWELKVGLEAARSTPPTSASPTNRPVGRVATTKANAFSKARWDFDDGSSITVAGAGFVHTTTTSKVANAIFLSGNQVTSFGTGRFEGCNGTKTAAIGLWLPPHVPFKEAGEVQMKSLDVFRIFGAEVIGPPPQLPATPPGA